MLFWILIVLLWLPVTICYPTKLIGKKNISKKKCIYACNHQSNIDPVILAVRFFTTFYSLGKVELVKNKLAKWFFGRIKMIPVNRQTIDVTSIKTSLRVLKEKNKPLLIFPTGTRKSSAEEVENLKNGVAMFSVKSQAPIIPMVFIKQPKLFRRNRLVVGEPLDMSKYEGKKADKELFNEISNDLTLAMQKLLNENMFEKTSKKIANRKEVK